MNTLDIILLLAFVPGIIRGASKGVLEQAVSFAGVAAGAWTAYHYNTEAAAFLGRWITADEKVMSVLGFVLILVLVIIATVILAKLVTKIVEMAALGWLNRVLGVLLSVFITAILLGMLAGVFDSLNAQMSLVPEDNPLLKESLVYPALRDFTRTVLPFLTNLL